MKAFLYSMIVVGLLAGVATAASPAPAPKLIDKGPDCTQREEANRVLEKGSFVLFYRGTIDTTTIESWLNGAGMAITLSYDTPKDNKAESINKVCILSFAEKVSLNGEVVEKLYEMMNKKAPKT
jgi:hypothetical protein